MRARLRKWAQGVGRTQDGDVHEATPADPEPEKAPSVEADAPPPAAEGYRTKRVFGIKTWVVRFGGAVYFVPHYAALRPVSQKVLGKRYYSPNLHAVVQTVMSARPGSMVHAGTFFGDMLPSFSRKTPGLVYAFEPVLENYLLANALVKANDLDNVVLLHAGLGESNGVARIETHNEIRHTGGGSHIITDAATEGHRPQVVPLLSIDQFQIEDLSLLQLDVEGYELPVLEGAIETIRSQTPVIVIEDLQKNCSGLLSELGYSEVGRVGRDYLYLTAAAEKEFGDLAEARLQDLPKM